MTRQGRNGQDRAVGHCEDHRQRSVTREDKATIRSKSCDVERRGTLEQRCWPQVKGQHIACCTTAMHGDCTAQEAFACKLVERQPA
jgi:hypothetical protein